MCKFESPVKNMFLIICKCTFGNVNYFNVFFIIVGFCYGYIGGL